MKHLLQIFLLFLTCFTKTVNPTAVFAKVAFPTYQPTFSKTENEVEKSIIELNVLAVNLKAVNNNLKKVVFPTTGTWTPALVSDIKPLLQNGSALFSKSPNIQTEIDNLITAGIDPEVIKQYLSGLEDISHTDPRFLEVLDDIKSFPNPRTTPTLKSHVETFARKVKEAGSLATLLAKWDNLTIPEAKSLYIQLSKTEVKGSKTAVAQSSILAEINASNSLVNPYNFAHSIDDIVLNQEALFVRVHNSWNPNRPWLISIEEFRTFTSQDDMIKKLALPILDNTGNIVKPV
jgi:hypothetical protein